MLPEAPNKVAEWIRVYFCPQCLKKRWQRPELWQCGVCDNCDYINQTGIR